MEEKLFWISMVSGVYAYAFKRFMRSDRSLDDRAGVVALNGLFWAFAGVAAGFLMASYKELETMTWAVGVVCAAAGGLLGALWVLPIRAGRPGLTQGLWALQGVCFSTALGRLLDLPRSPLVFGAVGFGLLGLAAGHLARTASMSLSKASVAGFLGLQGALAGYWLSGVGQPEPSLWMILGLAALGYFLGNGWRPRLDWNREGNAALLRDTREWADTGFSAILLAAAIMYFVVQAFKIPSGSMRMTLLEGDHLFVNKFLYGLRVPYTGDRLFRWRDVRRGDVVVFRFPAKDKASPHHGKDFIKRAIGLPGDSVEIRDKRVFVNGERIAEPYVRYATDFVIPSPVSSVETEERGGENYWHPLRVPAAYQKAWVEGDFSPPDRQGVRDNFGPVTVPPGHYLVMGDNRDQSYDSRFWGPMPDSHLKGRAWLLYLPFRRWKIIR